MGIGCTAGSRTNAPASSPPCGNRTCSSRSGTRGCPLAWSQYRCKSDWGVVKLRLFPLLFCFVLFCLLFFFLFLSFSFLLRLLFPPSLLYLLSLLITRLPLRVDCAHSQVCQPLVCSSNASHSAGRCQRRNNRLLHFSIQNIKRWAEFPWDGVAWLEGLTA